MNTLNAILSYFPINEWTREPLYVLLALIFLAVGSCQFLGKLLSLRSTSQEEWSNFQERLRTWWIIILPLAFCLALGPIPFAFLLTLVCTLAVREILQVFPLHASDSNLKTFLYLLPWLFSLAICQELPFEDILIPPLLLCTAYMVLKGNQQQFLERIGYIYWIILGIIFPMGFLTWLCFEAPGHEVSVGRAGVVIWVIFITQISDALQFSFGKLFGKHLIVPQISPKKTWEGFIGGVLSATFLGSYSASWLTEFSTFDSFLMALSISMAGFFGDTALSGVKRGLGIKDFSDTLKGHGGILDRIDSLLFAAPISYMALRYFY